MNAFMDFYTLLCLFIGGFTIGKYVYLFTARAFDWLADEMWR